MSFRAICWIHCQHSLVPPHGGEHERQRSWTAPTITLGLDKTPSAKAFGVFLWAGFGWRYRPYQGESDKSVAGPSFVLAAVVRAAVVISRNLWVVAYCDWFEQNGSVI